MKMASMLYGMLLVILVGLSKMVSGSALNMIPEERSVGTSYSTYEQKALLDQHNIYRATVDDPEASDMIELVSHKQNKNKR